MKKLILFVILLFLGSQNAYACMEMNKKMAFSNNFDTPQYAASPKSFLGKKALLTKVFKKTFTENEPNPQATKVAKNVRIVTLIASGTLLVGVLAGVFPLFVLGIALSIGAILVGLGSLIHVSTKKGDKSAALLKIGGSIVLAVLTLIIAYISGNRIWD